MANSQKSKIAHALHMKGMSCSLSLSCQSQWHQPITGICKLKHEEEGG